MRLSTETIAALLKGFEDYAEVPESYELYLFGSRTDPLKKGGDIDILLLVDERDWDRLQPIKHRLVVALKKYIDEQKLDLTIVSREKAPLDPLYLSIKDSLVLLKRR